MADVFQIFRLILGVIISVFILFFLLRFTGVYSGFQADVRTITIMENFLQTSGNVYVSGNPVPFTDFSRIGDDVVVNGREEPPELQTTEERVTMTVPLLFLKDDELLVSRGAYDLGWWTFSYAIALPETVIVFNPLDPGETDTAVIRDIAGVFPSTSVFSPNVAFTFCDGDELDQRYDRRDLVERSSVLAGLDTPAEPCRAALPHGAKLVTISGDCAVRPVSGACIVPDDVGSAFVGGRGYLYRDPLDLAFLLISAGGEDLFGEPLDVSYYQYKNTVFSSSLSLASAIEQKRRELIQGDLDLIMQDAEERLAISHEPVCGSLYADLISLLGRASESLADDDVQAAEEAMATARQRSEDIQNNGCLMLPASSDLRLNCLFAGFLDFRPVISRIHRLAQEDYTDSEAMQELHDALADAREQYETLVSLGCEING